MKTKVEVDLVDVAGGNLGSVSRCLRRMQIPYRLVNPVYPPDGTKPIILPGVGNFGAVMNSLRNDNFDQLILKLVREGTPYLGICVGMQILFEGSEESSVAGFGLLPGKVVKFRQGKIPQIGWNQINPTSPDWKEGYVYFVNSYVAEPLEPSDILYSANYFGPFCAAVARDNITAFQFHPEKSGDFGKALLNQWVQSVSTFSSDQKLRGARR
ncbi:MAG: imidazole glycerol phosphate synthase subunit HisH [Leptolyngbya sp.]|nr:imidazole glycerol phosphate synthase subunit HisH [Candidatus Melainabacteria bacterium]